MPCGTAALPDLMTAMVDFRHIGFVFLFFVYFSMDYPLDFAEAFCFLPGLPGGVGGAAWGCLRSVQFLGCFLRSLCLRARFARRLDPPRVGPLIYNLNSVGRRTPSGQGLPHLKVGDEEWKRPNERDEDVRHLKFKGC